MKGHPAWPAELVPDDVFVPALGPGALDESQRRLRRFQFFGGGSYALEKSGKCEVFDWQNGLKLKLDVACKLKSFQRALASAKSYLETGVVEERGWWSQPAAVVERVSKKKKEAKKTTKTTKTTKKKTAAAKSSKATASGRQKRAREADVGASEAPTPTKCAKKTDENVTMLPISPPAAFVAARREFCPPLSVLSLGKPPPYDRIHRSVFVSVPPPSKLHKSETSVCECRPPNSAKGQGRLGCGADCLNRRLRFSCDSRTCPCGDSCGNRPLSQLPTPKTKIVRTENRGWGLVLQEPVKSGAFIVEYAGEILDEPDCAARLWHDKLSGEENFYLMEISANYVIDAKYKGSIARFINSSCHPNCETQRWVDAATNETRVGIFATEDLESGTELTYDYNFAHFGDESGTSFVCMCGHPKCRGTLDAAKSGASFINRRLRVKVLQAPKNGKKGKKRLVQVRGVVVAYDRRSDKYKIQIEGAPGEHVLVRLGDGDKAAPHTWID